MSGLVDTQWVEMISADVFLILIFLQFFFSILIPLLTKKTSSNHKGAPSFCGNRCMKYWYVYGWTERSYSTLHTYYSGPIKVNLEFSFLFAGFSFSGLHSNIYLGFKTEIHFICQFQFSQQLLIVSLCFFANLSFD